MGFDREEYRQQIAGKAKERITADAKNLHMIERAALDAVAVTSDPHWDLYLSYLQNAIEETKGQKARLMEKLGDSRVVESAEIMHLKLHIAECTGMLNAWIVARDLPKELMENGDKARSLLEKVEEITA